MPEVFISYSRKDTAFVKRLIKELNASGYSEDDIWVDWEDIPASSEWKKEIESGIEGVNSVIFVISPNWRASVECAKELRIATRLKKRLFPVIYKEVVTPKLQPALSEVNWIRFDKGDSFRTGVSKLIDAIKTDLGWLSQHTDLLRRSNEWNAKGRDSAYLLRGMKLQEAENWLADAGKDKQREPTALQTEYILASRQDDVRRQRRNLLNVVIALGVSILLAISAIVAGIEALRQSQRALASQLAAQATSLVNTQPDLSLLLSLESNYIGDQVSNPDPAWLGGLVTSLNSSPHLVTYLREHTNAVRAVDFSADGKWLASAGEDNRIIIWDLASSSIKSHMVLEGATSRLLAVRFSEDSRYVFGAGDDKAVFRWDLQKGGDPVKWDVGKNIRALDVVVLNGQELLAVAAGPEVTFWDVEKGSMSPSLTLKLDANAGIRSMDVTPDNKLLAVGSDDGYVSIWGLSPQEFVRKVCVYDDAGSNAKNVCQESGSLDVRAIAFSRDGAYIVSGSSDSYARLWDVNTGQLLARTPESLEGGHSNTISSVAFNNNGTEVTTASWDNTVRIWKLERVNANEWKFILAKPLIGHSNSVWVVAYSPGQELLVSGSSDNTLIVWKPKQVSQIAYTPAYMQEDVWALAVSPNGKQVSAGDGAGNIHLWNFNGKSLSDPKPLKQPEGVLSLAFSPDNQWLASAGYDKAIHVWNVQSGKESWSIPSAHDQEIWSVLFSPDGRYLASASFDTTVKIWDVATHQQVGDPLQHKKEVYALAFNGDKTKPKLLVAGYEEDIYVWDLSKLPSQPVAILMKGHQAAVNSLAFNPVYPSILASTSDDKTLLIWNVDTGQPTKPVWGLNESMEAVAFRPLGDELASATNNKTVLIWKWDTRCGQKWVREDCQPIQLGSPLVGHKTAVQNVIFLSDTKLLSSSEDGQLILWDLDKSFWYRKACAIVNRRLSDEEKSQYIDGRVRTGLLKVQSWFLNNEQPAPSCLSDNPS